MADFLLTLKTCISNILEDSSNLAIVDYNRLSGFIAEVPCSV